MDEIEAEPRVRRVRIGRGLHVVRVHVNVERFHKTCKRSNDSMLQDFGNARSGPLVVTFCRNVKGDRSGR